MIAESHAVVAIGILGWATLVALVAVFLRMALRPDAGFGAVGRGRIPRNKVPPRTVLTPIAIPPRHVPPYAASRR